LFLILLACLFPGLWSIGVQLHSVCTGSYVPGHYSVLVINTPNEQTAKDVGRYALRCFSSNTFCHFRFYWKGEIQDANEILMVTCTRFIRTCSLCAFRSIHPYGNPEVLSLAVDDGSLAYMKWMDEAIPDD
uniref:Protein CutA homolog n=1 Tax=Pundamilia nyererei TaxID=303518 RepID=A0A3B4EZ52_9CICH